MGIGVDLNSSITIPQQIIEKAAEEIHNSIAEAVEVLERMVQEIEKAVKAVTAVTAREKIDTPYRPVCNKAVLLDKRQSVHRCRNAI